LPSTLLRGRSAFEAILRLLILFIELVALVDVGVVFPPLEFNA